MIFQVTDVAQILLLLWKQLQRTRTYVGGGGCRRLSPFKNNATFVFLESCCRLIGEKTIEGNSKE